MLSTCSAASRHRARRDALSVRGAGAVRLPLSLSTECQPARLAMAPSELVKSR
jgi:hypothetical protein